MPAIRPASTSTSPTSAVRRRRLAALTFAFALALTGCGGGSADGADAERASAGSVDDAFGSVDIGKADRVVALSVSDADAALSVGVVPVAMTEAPVEPVMSWAEETSEAAQTAIDDAAEDHPDLTDRSFLVALFHSPDEVGVLTDRDSATVQFFSELGLTLDPVADKMADGSVPGSLSLEKLDAAAVGS
ncbi:hypothetical protein [Brevibacterium permense]|uniref:hypothetical protein n=1 Tax=Brevibacterium permense TaxID=234834 RepID=UPI0021D2A1CC|nr:hypothetical protein [Brevibacterium permense]